MKHLIAALLLSATPALAFDPSAMTAPERTAFNAAVRAYLMDNPEVLIEAMTVLEQRREIAEAENDSALIRQHHAALFDESRDWVGGNPDGNVTLVEFVDYRCGVCRQVASHVEEVVETDGEIRFVIKDLPILGQQSDLAARFAVAVLHAQGNAAYKALHDHFFTMRGDVSIEMLRRYAEDQGWEADALIDAMTSEAVEDQLRANAALADQLSIAGTPSFILGEQLLRGMPRSGLKPVIDAVRDAQEG